MAPPSQEAVPLELVVEEILEEQVDSIRGRRNPHAVKRKISSYLLNYSQPGQPQSWTS